MIFAYYFFVHSFRNCKTSQEVIDYVRSRLSGRTEADTSQQDLIAICEAVSIACLVMDTCDVVEVIAT